jgi:hypothetical protein
MATASLPASTKVGFLETMAEGLTAEEHDTIRGSLLIAQTTDPESLERARIGWPLVVRTAQERIAAEESSPAISLRQALGRRGIPAQLHASYDWMLIVNYRFERYWVVARTKGVAVVFTEVVAGRHRTRRWAARASELAPVRVAARSKSRLVASMRVDAEGRRAMAEGVIGVMGMVGIVADRILRRPGERIPGA